jgi:FkbM family methyltransferase
MNAFAKHIARRLQRTIHRAGVDIRPTRQNRDVVDFLENRQIDTVLDVGANTGQFAASLRSLGYKNRIISFEPIKSVFETLVRRAGKDGRWGAHNFALGATSGEAVINVSDYSVFSSMLPTTSAVTEFSASAAVTHKETIEVRTLDETVAEMSGRIFLKIDTQGYERQVLEGGRNVLSRFKGILMELPIVQFYEGNWQFHEAVEFMASVGFIPAQIHPVNYHSKDTVSLVEVDCLFRPRD